MDCDELSMKHSPPPNLENDGRHSSNFGHWKLLFTDRIRRDIQNPVQAFQVFNQNLPGYPLRAIPELEAA
jgi:hypothetical protein